MKNFFLIIVTSAIAIFTVNYLVFAWTEPTVNPPNDNVAAPLNVGAGRQIKSGDISLNNLKATSMTLGGETRFAWPSGGVGGQPRITRFVNPRDKSSLGVHALCILHGLTETDTAEQHRSSCEANFNSTNGSWTVNRRYAECLIVCLDW